MIEVDSPYNNTIVHKYESTADVCSKGQRFITESGKNSNEENCNSSAGN